MHPTVPLLGVLSLATGAALGCADYTAPTGPGCTADQASGVVLEGDSLLARVYVTREYTEVGIVDGRATTLHYRICQSHTCREAREDPAAPLGDTEAADALVRCTAQADAFWTAEHPD